MRCVAQGDTVGGQFRLISELGQGGMGTVWRAEHLRLRSHVAVKIIDPVIALDPQAVHRFLREARTAAALRSPHIVQILDYGVDGERPYIAMELLDGESLAERLKRGGRLSVAETARVIRHVARALARAHDAEIVHRDLKPENIFVVQNDDEALIKVLDFGIAKARPMTADQSAVSLATRTGALMGTPHFMSPEQAEGLTSVDFRADLWALGVVAFECLLGELPFKGNSVTQVVLAICRDPLPVPSQIGPVLGGFDGWFARACARNPGDRFQSAKQAADAFERLESIASAPESRRSSPAPSSAASDPRAPASVGRQLAAEAFRRWALQSRMPLATLAGLLLLGGGIGLAMAPFDGAHSRAVANPVLPASALPGPSGHPSQHPPAPTDAPAPQAPLPQAILTAPTQPGGPLLERDASAASSPQAEPAKGLDRAARAGAVNGANGPTNADRSDRRQHPAMSKATASRRARKSSTVGRGQDPASRRNIDLGF